MGSGGLDYCMLILAADKDFVVSGAARSLPDSFEWSIGDTTQQISAQHSYLKGT